MLSSLLIFGAAKIGGGILATFLVMAIALAMVGFASSPNVRDALLKLTRALPGAASTTVTVATAIDTGAADSQATQSGRGEFLLTAPALTTTILPDTRTMTYDIIVSANSDLSSPTVKIAGAIVQTGAGGAGAAAATYRFRPASDWPRYIGFRITSGASTTDASATSASLEFLA